MRVFSLVFAMLSFLTFAQGPTAQFTGTPLTVCIGTPVTFISSSTQGTSPIVSYSYDFGDGNSANTANTSHTYSAPGTYTVILVVTDQNGNADAEVKAGYITVNANPAASFTTSGNGCTVPFDVTFTNTSTSGAGINYSWNFGNGQTSTLQNPPLVTYASAGNYNVSLTVTNTSTGCTANTTQTIVVSNFNTDFNAPMTICVGQAASFTDMSTVGANSWSWNFGDGQTSTSQNPSVTYGAPGVYNVTLASQNTLFGCTDNFSQNITVNPSPTPDFVADVLTGCTPLDVNFTNNSPGNSNYVWNFGNGSTFNGENPPVQTYTTDGSFTVSLTMTDGNGCSGTTSFSNYILTTPPVASFTADVTRGCEPLGVQFTSTSTSVNPIADPIVTWLWDFGDGSPIFSGEIPPVHNYNVGIYSVTLTVFTANGCSATITQTDYIEVGSIDVVNFSVVPQIECAKTPIQFTDLTTFNGTPDPGEVIYAWDFGDGGTSTLQDPSYPYPSDTGYFEVTLIVDWRGCKDTLVMMDAVYIKAPISLFSPASTLFCNPASFPVNVGVTDNAIIGQIPDDVEMIWKWGDGTFTNFDDIDVDDADQGTTSHDYNAYGSYTIEQVIYNNTTGCSDSTTAIVHISETIAGFTLSNDSTCVGSPITLTSTSTSSHPFGTFSYDMGNSGTTSGTPASYVYPASGTFVVTLTATNNVGCADNTSFNDMVALALPTANIIAPNNVGCAPHTVTYSNGSSVNANGVALSSFNWIFPDLTAQTTNSLATNVNYTFNTEGNFNVLMTATDVFGCNSPQTSVPMTITKPTANFTLVDVVCDLENFTTTNQSTGVAVVTYEWFVDGVPSAITTDLSSSFDETGSSSITNFDHDIELIATDGNGCKDTMNQLITVSMPYANFNYVLSGASVNAAGDFTCPPVFADYTDLSNSIGNLTNFNWNFGDGKTSTLQDPGNTYVFAGTYSMSFTITDEYGCTDDTTLVDYLTIFGPTGNPSWVSSGDLCGQTYIFDLSDTVNVSNVTWTFNDGQFAYDDYNLSHTYIDPGTYNPTVTLFDALGCDIIYPLNPITVNTNGLSAGFIADPVVGSMFSSVSFDDLSTSSGSPIVSWVWDFGESTVTANSGINQSYNFGLPGDYPVSLLITDSDGCTDVAYLTVTVDDAFSVPNVFTPNGDGTNDFFTLKYDVFKSYDILILNRWGNVMEERYDSHGTLLWDGTNKGGDECSDGVYFYLLTGEIVNGKTIQKHGNVTLIRNK